MQGGDFRAAVPLDEIVVEELLAWHPVCGFPKPEDWVFASYQTFGKMPMWPDSFRRKILQPIARKVGIRKRIGWHTFRRTYSSLLVATGNNVKVVQGSLHLIIEKDFACLNLSDAENFDAFPNPNVNAVC